MNFEEYLSSLGYDTNKVIHDDEAIQENARLIGDLKRELRKKRVKQEQRVSKVQPYLD